MPTWLGQTVSAAEYARLKAEYEERAFQRQPKQGELCVPMFIRDDQKPLMSMTNGRIYDSKSEMRKEYRRAGVVELGNDAPTERAKPSYMEKEAAARKRKAAVGKALSQAGFGA